MSYQWRTPDDGVPAALRAMRQAQWLPPEPGHHPYATHAAVIAAAVMTAGVFAAVVVALCLVASAATRYGTPPATCQVAQTTGPCAAYESDRHWHEYRMVYGRTEDLVMPNGWAPR